MRRKTTPRPLHGKLKRHPFPVGALVVNTGRLRGQGYIWRVERYDRCEHPSGPHPMHAPCGWFAAKTQGAMA